MVIFTGQQLNSWQLWGVWFKHKYFIGFSRAINQSLTKEDAANPPKEQKDTK